MWMIPGVIAIVLIGLFAGHGTIQRHSGDRDCDCD
jgi:hypothetical protein